MFSLIRAAEECRLVDAGRVACPLREREADIEDCLHCGFAREVVPEKNAPFVRCRPPRKPLLLP